MRRRAVRWAAGWLGAAFIFFAAAAGAEPVRITFLHFNDVDSMDAAPGRGGVAELATLLARERATATHSITTFGGDTISPSVLSGMTGGAHMIDLLGTLGVDVAVLGNHEFDFGPAVTAARIAESRFPWLGTNVLDGQGRPAVGAVASLLRPVGGVTVGFFGLLTPYTRTSSSPGEGIMFAPIVETAARAVADLRRQGADVVVALTHQHLADDRLLAREVPGIDLILGGHDVAAIDLLEEGSLIHKSGAGGRYLGVVDLLVDRKDQGGKVTVSVLPSWRVVPTVDAVPDPAVTARVESWQAKLEAGLDEAIGTTATDLDLRQSVVRGREAAFGNLVADALRARLGADVALMNGGGIRGDRVIPAGTALTRRHVMSALPFANRIVHVEVTGAALHAALEHAVSGVEHGAGRFVQVSGLAFTYDPEAPAGQRIRRIDVGGARLDPAGSYRVATIDYLARGGDGFAPLATGTVLLAASDGPLLAPLVVDHIAAHAPVAPKVEGRIATVR